ncbi:hypothetical protein [Stenotrophomonas sp. 364]|uniref:hypothetical protein n=1 Tax=Stenotrophomonas sp. 364 TaxID=2691571 RepID=UPI001315B3C3|nr:hypothetical protein [Stenotrophomonas sp. 364]QHB70629.1 hypothetical protein GQ674_04530 [Stenotrophomonas sp. 364]
MDQASNSDRSATPSDLEQGQDEEQRRCLLIAVLRGDCCAVRLALASLSDGKSAQHALRVAAGLGHANIASMIIQSALPDAADALDAALAAAIKDSQAATVRQLLYEASRFAEPPALMKSLCAAGSVGAVDLIDEIMFTYRPSNKSLITAFRFALVEKRWPAAVHIFDAADARLFDRWITETDRSCMNAYRAIRQSDTVRKELDHCTKPLAVKHKLPQPRF